MQTFVERLHQPVPLLLDGATGTELTRRGIPTPIPLWSAAALTSNPQAVQHIHLDYLQAGADIITTNTFRTHRRNVGAEAGALTRLAVQLAQAAVAQSGKRAYVAGSVAPLEDCYSPHLTPDEATCLREHAEIMQGLVGVDVVLIETMNTRHEAAAAARIAHEMGLPFMVSFVLNEQYDLLSGESLPSAVEAIEIYNPTAYLINCIPTRHLETALHRLRSCTSRPIGAYGNMGTPEDVMGWAFEGELTPGDYCDHAATWLHAGAQIIGSCCGSSPEHTRALRRLLDGQFAILPDSE